MRVTRSLMLWMAVAIAVGGCAQQPVMRVQMAAVPAPQGIDNVIYGAAPAYGAAAAPAYATASVPAYRTAAAPTYATASVPAYRTAAAPAYAMASVPAYRTATAPAYAMASVPAYQTAAAPAYAMASAPTYAAPAAPTYAAPAAPAYATAAAPAYGMNTASLYDTTAAPAAMARGLPGGMAFGGRVGAAPVSYSYAPTAQWPYALDSGDRLRIVVFGQDGLTNSYVLDASGQIAMPLIGAVSARGLTTDQLSERIAEMLRQGYVREPHVAVEIEAYRPFFILGEVTQPGQYPYVANMTVETAVAIAGGFGPRAERKQITVSRNLGGQVFRFDAPVTSPVRPGDTIQVQERWF